MTNPSSRLLIVAITDGWISEVHPDGTGKLIADISAAAVAEEEHRRLIKRVEAGIARRSKANGPGGFLLASDITTAISKSSSTRLGEWRGGLP